MAAQSVNSLKKTTLFHVRSGLLGVAGLAMSVYSAWLLWLIRDGHSVTLVVSFVLCALIVAGIVMALDAWRELSMHFVVQEALSSLSDTQFSSQTPSSQAEVVSEFEVEGMHFLVLWKLGLCLLRTIECYGTDQAKQYTVSDLFVKLYDGSPDYELSREEAIEQAPLVASMLVHEQRLQELAYMERQYTSPEMQRDYPVYKNWEQEVGGVAYPVIWASHNAGLYWQMDGQWCVAGFAKSREEAEAKIAKAAQSDAD